MPGQTSLARYSPSISHPACVPAYFGQAPEARQTLAQPGRAGKSISQVPSAVGATLLRRKCSAALQSGTVLPIIQRRVFLPRGTKGSPANFRSDSARSSASEPKGVTIFVYANNHYSGLP